MDFNVYDMKRFTNMSRGELIPWLLDTATLQEAHLFHCNNWPDWVPGARRFREHAALLGFAEKAAEFKDLKKIEELDQAHADTLLSINLNACYIVMRSIHEKDESLLHNAGYLLKEKAMKHHGPASVSDVPLNLKVKSGEAGSATIRYPRDRAAGLYHLQYCKGVPAGEESWGDYGFNKGCLVVATGLDRASWYYFRVRALGSNKNGPWSTPLGVIIT